MAPQQSERTGMKHIDAELKMDPRYKPEVGRPMIGFVYNDARGRFSDGTTIMTTVVQAIEKTEGKTIVTTKNTVYQLV
jgi:hypothetical protein